MDASLFLDIFTIRRFSQCICFWFSNCVSADLILQFMFVPSECLLQCLLVSVFLLFCACVEKRKTGTFITPANGLENEALHLASLPSYYLFLFFSPLGHPPATVFSGHLMHLNLKYISDHCGAVRKVYIEVTVCSSLLISCKMTGLTVPGSRFSHQAQLVERINL